MAVSEDSVFVRTVSKHFVTVGGRQVHYRQAGAGPPVILRHESPRSSVALIPHLEALAPRFTAIAIDTAGYGLSEPLVIEEPSVADYAADFGPTLDALGIDRCPIYGQHTGACIALEFARHNPERVSKLVLDGLPLFTDDERQEQIDNYTPTFEPQIDGGHLAAIWWFRRDGITFFPWFRRTLETRLHLDLSDPSLLRLGMHEGLLDHLSANPHYSLGYQAAFRYDPLPALREIEVPTAVVVGDGDVIETHLGRMPAGISPFVQTERLQHRERIGDLLAEAAASRALAARLVETQPGRLTKTYASTSWGQLLVRRSGVAKSRPLVMFHGSPGSAASLEPLIAALAPHRSIIALDMLGDGDSDKPDDSFPEQPWIGDFAEVATEAIGVLGLEELDLFGTHTGALIAIETSLLLGDRVENLILDGIPLLDGEMAQDMLKNYFIDLTPDWQGTYLTAAWANVRDSAMWFPWYKRDREHAMDSPLRTADEVAADFLELMKSGVQYPRVCRAAFRYPSQERLPLVKARTLICAHPTDPLHRVLDEIALLAPYALATTSPQTSNEVAEFYLRFLDGGNVGPI